MSAAAAKRKRRRFLDDLAFENKRRTFEEGKKKLQNQDRLYYGINYLYKKFLILSEKNLYSDLHIQEKPVKNDRRDAKVSDKSAGRNVKHALWETD